MNSRTRDSRRIRTQFQFNPPFAGQSSIALEPRLMATITMFSNSDDPGAMNASEGASANNVDPGSSGSVDYSDGTSIDLSDHDYGDDSTYEMASVSESYSGPTPGGGGSGGAGVSVSLSTQDTWGYPPTTASAAAAGGVNLVIQDDSDPSASLAGHTVTITLTATYSDTFMSGNAGGTSYASLSAGTSLGGFSDISDSTDDSSNPDPGNYVTQNRLVLAGD